MEFLERTNMLINTNSLKNKTIAVFGLGGVGCYVVEGLVRAGISSFILVDYDVFQKPISIGIFWLSMKLLVLKKPFCKKKEF